MTETIQTPFIVTQDDEFVPELSYIPPEPAQGIEAAVGHVQAAFGRFTGHIALQTRMAVFDARHGTHYRHIRNELVEQQRREAFERSIGIVAIEPRRK